MGFQVEKVNDVMVVDVEGQLIVGNRQELKQKVLEELENGECEEVTLERCEACQACVGDELDELAKKLCRLGLKKRARKRLSKLCRACSQCQSALCNGPIAAV